MLKRVMPIHSSSGGPQIAALLFLLVAGSALAAPAIVGVTGTPIEMGTLTIAGSGFGTHANDGQGRPFLVAAWNDFSSGAINGGNFALDGGNNSSWSLSTSDARPNHSYALKKVYNGNELGAYSYTNFGTRTTWYTSFWFKLPPNTQAGKFWRIWGSPQTDNMYLSSGGYNTMIRGFSESLSVSPAPTTYWGGPDSLGYGIWRRIDILASNSPSSLFKVWIDGKLQFTQTNWVPTPWNTAGHTLDIGDMIDSPARDNQGWNGAYIFSDIYHSYTQARVEIGNAPTWAACTLREIQLPVAWSASSVSVQVNQGAFPTGTPAYVYLVDSAGNVSGGYPITFSGTPPVGLPPPTNLHVVSGP